MVRILCWGVLLWSQIATLCIIGLAVGFALTTKIDPYVWFFNKAFDCFVIPAGVCVGPLIIAVMVDGRRLLKWPWWRVFLTLFAMGIPLYAIFYYKRAEHDLLRLQKEKEV